MVKLAIKADEEQRYKDAVKQYRSAGELFVLALKYETNPEVRNQIKSRLSGYITRAEELQKALDNGKCVFMFVNFCPLSISYLTRCYGCTYWIMCF